MPVAPPTTRRRPPARTAPTARLVTAGLAVLLALVAGLVAPPAARAATPRPFAPGSPFNTPVPAHPALDPASAPMVARAARTGRVNANLVAYGIPVYTADARTPTYAVGCTQDPAWGPCPFRDQAMAIPAGAVPSAGSDGALVVVDPVRGVIGEYWRATRTPTGWGAAWGAVNALDGSGWGGASTGTGASRLAGVVRVAEVRAGRIDHALVLQSDNLCRDAVRPPALKTDGASTRADCLPAGARLQLDPAVRLSSVRGLTRGERAVARALQVYGAYVVDSGGAPLSLSFERAADARGADPGAVYRRAGLRWDYDGLPHVPWRRLRVLAAPTC